MSVARIIRSLRCTYPNCNLSSILVPQLHHLPSQRSLITLARCWRVAWVPLNSKPTATETRSHAADVLINFEQRRFRRPKYLKRKSPPTRIVQFDYSGDLLKQAPVDADNIHIAYKNVKELETFPDEVRKLFTLDFADGNSVRDHRITQVLNHIQSKLGDDCELERKIASYTVGIRNEMQHCMAWKKDTRAKSRLICRIQKRKKYLRQLRSLDFERFVWILEELRIKYVIPPEDYVRPTKKSIRRDAATQEMQAEKDQKIAELREAFEKERTEFDEYKKATLKDIEADMKELGLTDTDVAKMVEDSIVVPEPDMRDMSKTQRWFYEKRKAKEAKQWRYDRKTGLCY